MRIILVGFMGAGKSSVGRALASLSSLPLIDTDQYIEARASKSIQEIFDLEGEAKFRQLEAEVVEHLENFPEAVIATGGGLPCHSDNISKLNRLGFTVYLSVPHDILADRLHADSFSRPLIQGKTREQIRKFAEEKLLIRAQFYEQCKFQIECLPDDGANQLASQILWKVQTL